MSVLMNSPRSKVRIGISLLVFFVIVLITGVILHLKKHGVVVEPRPLIKILHWTCGFMMIILACIHGLQFQRMFSGIKKKFLWFWVDTWAVIILTSLTFLTGLVKLLSPVKIPHLGMWHYGLGIAMAVVIAFHLVRGIPALKRLGRVK